MANSIPPIELAVTVDNSQANKGLQETTSETRKLAQVAREEANASKAAYQEKQKAAEAAARALRDANKEQKDAARQALNTAKDEVAAARDVMRADQDRAREAEKTARIVEQAYQAEEKAAEAAARMEARVAEDAARAEIKATEAAQKAEEKANAQKVKDAEKASQAAVKAANEEAAAIEEANQRSIQAAGQVRNGALMVAAAGVGGLRVLNKDADTSLESQNARQDEAALLQQQGRGGDVDKVENVVRDISIKAHLANPDELRRSVVQMLSDEVKTADVGPLAEAVMRNAQTMAQKGEKVDPFEISRSFSLAYSQGNLGRLRRQNINFTEEEQSAVKAAYAVSQLAGQEEFMRVVTAATARDTNELGASLSDAQKAANDTAREMHEFDVNTGAGAQSVRQFFTNLAVGALNAGNSAPGLEKVAGGVGEIVSGAAAGIGGLVAFGAQTFLAIKGARETIDWIGGIRKAKAEEAEQSVTTATTEVEANAAVEKSVIDLTATQEAAAKGAGDVATATETASTEAQAAIDAEIEKYRELLTIQEEAAAGAKNVGTATAEGSAIAGAGGAAEVGGLGVAGAGAGILGGAAAAAPVVAAAYVGQQGYKTESDIVTGDAAKLSDEKLKAKYNNSFSDNFLRATGQGLIAATGQGLTATLLGAIGPRLGDMVAGARRALGIGPKDKPAPKTAAPTPQPSATAPTTTLGNTPTPATSSAGGGFVPPVTPTMASAAGGYDDENSTDESILALESERRSLKGKKNADKRDALSNQIAQMRLTEREEKRAASEQEKAEKASQREANKAARKAEKEQKIEDRDDLAEKKAQDEEDATDRTALLQDKLDDAKKEGDRAAIGALTKQIEMEKARQKYNDALAAAAQADPERRARLEAIAKIHFRADENRAQRAGDKAADSEGEGEGRGRNRDAMIHDILRRMNGGFGGGDPINRVNLNTSQYASSSYGNGEGIGGLGSAGSSGAPWPKARGRIVEGAQKRYIEFERLELPDDGLESLEVYR